MNVFYGRGSCAVAAGGVCVFLGKGTALWELGRDCQQSFQGAARVSHHAVLKSWCLG